MNVVFDTVLKTLRQMFMCSSRVQSPVGEKLTDVPAESIVSFKMICFFFPTMRVLACIISLNCQKTLYNFVQFPLLLYTTLKS